MVLWVSLLTLAGCGPSVSPNEANVQGPPADPSTIPRSGDEMIARQRQRVADYVKASSSRSLTRVGR